MKNIVLKLEKEHFLRDEEFRLLLENEREETEEGNFAVETQSSKERHPRPSSKDGGKKQ